MAQNKKRTKQVQQMVDKTNQMLKEYMVSFDHKYDEGPAQNYFNVMVGLLLTVGCYKGFNEFYEKSVTIEGKEVTFNAIVEADTPQEKRFIQLY